MTPPTTFNPDDLVVLPSGRRGMVIKTLNDGRVECEIISEVGRLQGRTVCLKPDLLRKVMRGAPMPRPARVT